MKQIGNLAVVCARRKDVLLQILDGKATVYAGTGPTRQSLTAAWDDDGQISKLVYELNFGALSEKEVKNDTAY